VGSGSSNRPTTEKWPYEGVTPRLRRGFELLRVRLGPMHRFRRLVFLAIIAAISSGTALLGGTIIFSNLGVANAYSPGIIAGWTVAGSSVGFAESAMAFTSSGNFMLTQIDVAISYNNFGTNSAVLTLDSDSGGLPGAVLMTWTLTNLPTYGTCCILDTVTPASPVFLSSGKQYWLAATAGTNSSFDVWDSNSIGQIGPLSQTFTPNTFSGTNISTEGAFDVLGTPVPEPSTLLLLSGSLLLFGSCLVRHHKQSSSSRTA
jgi:hypothetical protein